MSTNLELFFTAFLWSIVSAERRILGDCAILDLSLLLTAAGEEAISWKYELLIVNNNDQRMWPAACYQ